MTEPKDPVNTNRVPIPGEHDHTTEAPTEPSIVGTTGYGVDLPPDLTADPTLTEENHERFRWEGGGRIPSAKKPSGSRTHDERDATDPKNLVPRLGPDTEAHPGERQPDERKPGSATGTISGDGPDR